MRFKIITAVWNSRDWIHGCAQSVLNQNEDYDVIMVDDGSTDGTSQLVEMICEQNGWQYHLNPENRGVPINHWMAISTLVAKPEDVLVFVDGDDRLEAGALTKLKGYYEKDTLLTYGQYRSDPFSPTCSLAGPYPQDVIDRRAYREHSLLGRGIPWNHLRTVRYEIASQLTEKDFQFRDGEWYRMSSDAAVMYPCLELAGDNFKFIPEVLYVYNSENPLSEWRKAPRDGDRVHQDVLHRTPKVTVVYDPDPKAVALRIQRGLH
jgi:glycosyltransferase involved in cell wall biosynthesis